MTEPAGRTPLTEFSLGELSTAFADGTVLPSEVTEAVLRRADQVDPALTVFSSRYFEQAVDAAEQADRRWREGRPLSRFDGVPVTVKDNIPVAGMRCEWGSLVFAGNVATEDEACVERLRRGGWVILGKTAVSEFTLGLGNVSTRGFGTTRNPWNPELTTGASSGGAAAAVACGIGPVALGTDGGGSVRWPASYCELVGLKPTLGRIPRVGGLPVVLHDLEVAAPLARSVEDVALLLDVLAGPHPLDRASLALPQFPPDPVEAPLRIRLVEQFGDYPVEDEIRASVRAAADQLAQLGHHVEQGPVPFDFAAFDTHWRTIGTSGLAWMLAQHPGWEQKVADIYPPMVEYGRSRSAADYVAAIDTFRQNFRELAGFFSDHDLLLTPVAGAMPWPAQELAPPYQRVFTGIANATGCPAITLPAPRPISGMPVGLQLIAPYGAEQRLLQVGSAYQHAYSWLNRRPPV